MENKNNFSQAENPEPTEWDSLTELANTIKSPEQIREEERKRGQKVLGAINFHESHKQQVEEAFNKARESGVKFGSGDNPRDRRISAYLTTFEGNSEQSTLEKEKEFFESQTEELLKDVPDYVKQNLRDQVEDWADYLGSEDAEYPTWFKLWAWDGMTRLGGYNTNTGKFDKRSKETIHTYPPLDKESVQDAYNMLKDYHNNPENFSSDLDQKYVQNYKFNEIYSHFMNKHIVPTPEFGEEIKGEWVEYVDGQEEEVAKAANGTGWCIVSPTKAKEYLEKGTFTFLHLENPHDFDEPDTHACASIRTENGKVAEISGRRPGSGQMLEDALVETVGRKVLTMPGGEEYREAFRDRMTLIRLCRKEEELSKEELEFVYEINHKIPKLEKHCAMEPHINELRTKYNLERAIELGVDKDSIVESVLNGNVDVSINEARTLQSLESLMDLNVPPEKILDSLSDKSIVDNLDRLTAGNVSLENVLGHISSNFIAGNISKLMEAGASSEEIFSKLKNYEVGTHINELLKSGADIQLVVTKLWPEDIIKNLDVLNSHGANIEPEKIIAEMAPREAIRSFDTINDLGVNYDVYGEAVSQISYEQIMDASTRDDISEFIKNPKSDLNRFLDAADPGIIPFVTPAIVARLKSDKETALNDGNNERADAINEQLKKFGYDEDDEDDWY